MALVTFQDLPSTSTPINSQNLNNNFNEVKPQVIYTGKLYGTDNITLSNVKNKLIVYARANTNDSLVYTIDIDNDVSSTKTYGSQICIAYDEASGTDYYLSESSFDPSNNKFTHERIGYFKLSTGTYVSRDKNATTYLSYYVYRIETID